MVVNLLSSTSTSPLVKTGSLASSLQVEYLEGDVEYVEGDVEYVEDDVENLEGDEERESSEDPDNVLPLEHL